MALYQHRTVYVGDIKTHFLEAGNGPDLVLLHGGEYGASAEITWRYNIDTLAQRFHILAPDIPGWGLTDKLYSFSDPAGLRIKHLQRFLETLGHRQGLLRRQLRRRRTRVARSRAPTGAAANSENGHHLRQRERVQN